MSYPLDRDAAQGIWEVLVEEAGAYDDKYARLDFLASQTNPSGCIEFRFCGHLGFGGKFWNNAERWYVSCYPEDLTPERASIILRANARLEVLRSSLVDNRDSAW